VRRSPTPQDAVCLALAPATTFPLASRRSTARATATPAGQYPFETAVKPRMGTVRRGARSSAIAKLDQEVNVTREKQAAALDPLGAAFSTVLTREQIAALPTSDEMERR
jgi:hypothetical protein